MTQKYIDKYGMPGQERVMELLAGIYVAVVAMATGGKVKMDIGDVLPYLKGKRDAAERARKGAQTFGVILEAVKRGREDG